MLGAEEAEEPWLSDQAFAMKYGFEEVDSTKDGYKLLALSFDGTLPHFAPNAKRQAVESKELTVPSVDHRTHKVLGAKQHGITASSSFEIQPKYFRTRPSLFCQTFWLLKLGRTLKSLF